VVPESNMPGFPWLATTQIDADGTAAKMRALRKVGVPYSDTDIAAAHDAVAGHSEQDALIDYLQSLGIASKTWVK
jgi:cytochrome c oxidase cbb3-type subunit 2